jgi:hypothetical protein
MHGTFHAPKTEARGSKCFDGERLHFGVAKWTQRKTAAPQELELRLGRNVASAGTRCGYLNAVRDRFPFRGAPGPVDTMTR